MQLDIREYKSKIKSIIFSDFHTIGISDGNYILIKQIHSKDKYLSILDEDIDNLILALQKVKELKGI